MSNKTYEPNNFGDNSYLDFGDSGDPDFVKT
jgi:hypothetical protein